MTDEPTSPLLAFIRDYCENVEQGFSSRWSQLTPEIYRKEIHETIGGLAARQATLSIELARAPSIWNGHVAPLILRCMTDAHITLAWILESPVDRSREYVLYGLGQEKLFIEYLEQDLQSYPSDEQDEDIIHMIEVRRAWLNAQRRDWATEVNVGSWSGKNAREMAQEAGCESMYRFAYVPFSGPVHNMWQHVGVHNLVPCTNPLHKWHQIPTIRRLPIHPDFLYRAAKYVSRTYELLDDKLSLHSEITLPVDFFENHPFMCGSNSNEPEE